MSDHNQYDPFSVCFNILKMKYKDYDESISSKDFVQKYDKVNVFINLETVFKHLSMIQDLEKKIVLQRDYQEILVSNILNLAAHYKRFFISNFLYTKVYLYHTDLESDDFHQYKYNEDYRTYYMLKYNENPKFIKLTEALKSSILPEVKTYCEFIPNVYYISSHNIEGSLVPYIISKTDEERKNFIIGGEFYDTQYSTLPNFVNHRIHKTPGKIVVSSSIKEYLKDSLKKSDEDTDRLYKVFNNHSSYCSLMSVLGDRMRSIDGISGVGPITLYNLINEGIYKKEIQLDTTNPSMIGNIFHDDEMKEEFVNNYYCTSILSMYDELTAVDKISVLNQIRDRNDMNSLINLNKTRFCNHPLILESLSL